MKIPKRGRGGGGPAIWEKFPKNVVFFDKPPNWLWWETRARLWYNIVLLQKVCKMFCTISRSKVLSRMLPPGGGQEQGEGKTVHSTVKAFQPSEWFPTRCVCGVFRWIRATYYFSASATSLRGPLLIASMLKWVELQLYNCVNACNVLFLAHCQVHWLLLCRNED